MSRFIIYNNGNGHKKESRGEKRNINKERNFNRITGHDVNEQISHHFEIQVL